MVKRDVYDGFIERIYEISKNHSGMSFEREINELYNIRDNFDIKLMFVGHFSAGKSSLINMLIGKKEFLKEGQNAETAMATEITYNEQESAYAYDLDGNKEKLNYQKKYKPDEYKFLEYKINSKNLRTISDFTIVDTPGFDAGIEAHAKALANYIGKGSVYLVVIDQEKGGIDEINLDFIQEISNYSSQIAILINKCDKITDEIMESIAEDARYTLAIHGLPYEVHTISKWDNDIVDKLTNIISSFNAQIVFENVMKKYLKLELVRIEKVISTTKSTLFLDTYNLDREISKLSSMKDNVNETFTLKKEEISANLNNISDKVIAEIRSSLIDRSQSIVEALLSGNNVASEAIIVEAIRPILLASMKDISVKQIDDVTRALDFSGLFNGTEGLDLGDYIVSLADKLKDLVIQSDCINYDVEKHHKNTGINGMYRLVTGLVAMTTNIVAPWAEIIVFLLPDIINLLNRVLGESEVELAKRRFINNVIPQITNKLFPLIKQNVDMTINMVLKEYERMVSEQIESIKNNISDAEAMKVQKMEEFEKYKLTLTKDLEEVRDLLVKVGGYK